MPAAPRQVADRPATDERRRSVSAVAGPPVIRTVNLNLGNAAEQNMVSINAAHITHVRLTGSMSSSSRKMELFLVSGSVVGMNFDDPDYAETVFSDVIETINKTIPDHVTGIEAIAQAIPDAKLLGR